MKKRYFKLFLLLMLFVLYAIDVNAVTYTTGDSYNFNRDNGTFGATGNYGTDKVKYFNDSEVFCVDFKLHMGNGSSYSKVSSWTTNSKRAIIAGLIMEKADQRATSQNYGDVKRYALKAASLNSYMAKYQNSSYSRNFYDKNSEIKNIIDAAINDYNNVILSTKLAAPSYVVSDPILSYSSNNKYISDKITVNNLLKTYAGSDVTYTLTAKSSSGKVVKLCPNRRDSGCVTSKTLTGVESYDFYVLAAEADAGDNITVNIKASNKSSYPSSVMWMLDGGHQRVMEETVVTINRSNSLSTQLTVPDTTHHRIVAYKVDDNGDLLKGSSLELYKDDASISTNRIGVNSNGTSSVSYTSSVVATQDDDFFSHTYYLVEKSAPTGYQLDTTVIEIPVSNTSGSSCYYNENEDTTVKVEGEAAKHCNFDDYQYLCKPSNSDTPVALSSDKNCDFTTPEDKDEVTGGGSDTGSGEGTGGTGEGTGGTGEGTGGTDGDDDTPEVTITYEKKCYYVNGETKTSVDESFCADVGKYTLITHSGGNVTVKAANHLNHIKISKQAATGDEEVPGAALKICTKESYNSKKDDCEPAKTIPQGDDNTEVELVWISGGTPNEFSGIIPGDYYIIEITPPSGYVQAVTATPFSIDEKGSVTSGDTEVKDNLIVIKNGVNTVHVSKDDIATSKELPGATISICTTYKIEDGKVEMLRDRDTDECIPINLIDGTPATWVSTDKPHVITGLPSGTYYLVERIAPTGYSTAESILFVLRDDGKLTDINGKLLSDSKLVMHDKKISDVKTGMLAMYIIFGIVMFAGIGGVGSYLYLKKNTSNFV